jgi:hypothetical protein
MADQQGTQTDGAVAVAPESSTGASQDSNESTTGSTSTQVDNSAQVEAEESTEEGKSGSSDEGNGTSSKEGERSRPSRAERRISELHKQADDYRKRAESVEEENSRLRDMLKDPLKEADVKLPDYSKQENVTPQQLKQDIVNAADQIVKLRLDQYIPQNNRDMTVRQYRDRAYEDMQSAIKAHPELDPDNEETFDSKLDKFLAGTFKRTFDADPTYRFSELVNDVFEQRGGRDQTNTNSTGEAPVKSSKDSKTAMRQTGGSAKAHKPIPDMTADEYKEYFSSTRS